jgi:hypothetical protein
MADPFAITDGRGQARYEVKSVPDMVERLSLRTAGGGELAAIMRDGMSGGFKIVMAREQVALVRDRGLIRRQYLIDVPGGGLTVLNNAYQGTYAIAAGAGVDGLPRAQVWRQAVGNGSRISYDLRVIAADGDDTVQLLAIVLAIEYLSEDRRANLDELKAARTVMRLIGWHTPNI